MSIYSEAAMLWGNPSHRERSCVDILIGSSNQGCKVKKLPDDSTLQSFSQLRPKTSWSMEKRCYSYWSHVWIPYPQNLWLWQHGCYFMPLHRSLLFIQHSCDYKGQKPPQDYSNNIKFIIRIFSWTLKDCRKPLETKVSLPTSQGHLLFSCAHLLHSPSYGRQNSLVYLSICIWPMASPP